MRLRTVLIGITIILAGCTQPANTPRADGTLSVTASFYPLAYFAQRIGGDYVTVTQITPGGVEPHDYEPTPADVSRMLKSSLLIVNGDGIDRWADKLAPDLRQMGTTILRLSDRLTLDGAPLAQSHDPHTWLDPLLAAQEAELIRDALMSQDPSHKATYELNADALLNELHALDRAYGEQLAQCDVRTIITAHDAFHYLAKRYNFQTKSIAGLSPDAEPSPRTMADIATFAKQHGITYVFVETLANPKLSQTIASEVGAQTLVLNPIEGLTDAERQAAATYVSVMRENLANLRKAMRCM